MNPKDLSKFMSLILRHKPKEHGLVLDAEGYTPINELLDAIRSAGRAVTFDDVMNVVENVEPEKKRFSIVNNDIRANYGHSIDGKIQHEETAPPDELYHGTHDSVLSLILKSGLKPMNRQYVHLTTNFQLAQRVGGRRGKPVVLKIDTQAAYKGGIKFFKANETFWLVDEVPVAYIVQKPCHNGKI